MARKGKRFRIFARNLHDEKKLRQLAYQQVLRRYKTYAKTKQRVEAYTSFYCPRDNKHAELRCKFHGRYYPEFGNFYVSGEHNHPILGMKKGKQEGKFNEYCSDSDEDNEETEEELSSE